MEKLKMKYGIPDWCKIECKFRDKKAKQMPACQYSGKLKIENYICLSYQKTEGVKNDKI